MDLEHQYNQRNPAVKRLMREAIELKNATDEYFARPLEDNLFEWHFTVRGSPGTEYEGGVYHGRIILPPEYPMKPPNIIVLTPNGRFETNKKICLSISGHHPETWQPSWSIRTALLALIAFMSSPGRGSIGALDYTPEERKQLAKASSTWECAQCGLITKLLSCDTSPQPATQAEVEMLQHIDLKAEERTAESTSSESSAESAEQTTTNQDEPPLQQPPLPTSSPPPTMATPLQVIPYDLGSFGDYLLIFFVAALALLIARRMALNYFL